MCPPESHQDNGARAAARTAEDIADTARSAASEVGRETRRQAASLGAAGKERAAGRIDSIAAALDASAGELSGREDWLAGVIDDVAARLRSASDHLHTKDVQGLADEVSEFARKHPAVFMGSVVALGFAIGRVVTASEANAGERRTGGAAGDAPGPDRGGDGGFQ